jgi:hypothetical protein
MATAAVPGIRFLGPLREVPDGDCGDFWTRFKSAESQTAGFPANGRWKLVVMNDFLMVKIRF